jgi:hypothetical protein
MVRAIESPHTPLHAPAYQRRRWSHLQATAIVGTVAGAVPQTAGLAQQKHGLGRETAGFAQQTAGLGRDTAGLAQQTAGLARATVTRMEAFTGSATATTLFLAKALSAFVVMLVQPVRCPPPSGGAATAHGLTLEPGWRPSAAARAPALDEER